MTKNMGTTDKMIRLGVAIIIALLFFLDKISGTTAIVLGAIAVIFALTSLVSFCPLYTLIGVNSCEVKK
ncbi:MAG: DUF2892 domain-containing protein [Saprospiraceae bacterium]|nr:DUF2892 domain-containing protein [Saprospiraceae bacterium]MBL0100578.1 DUF2892 domain-containing protein [Saprospiraceae bacterium]